MEYIKEIWKDIEGYEGLYQVSNCGNVRSLDKTIYQKTKYGDFCNFFYKGKMLKKIFDKDGYLIVSLSNSEHKQRQGRVHRLVAEAFIPNPENKPVVGHLKTLENGLEDKTANEAWNLAWMTPEENANYGTLSERKSEMLKTEYETGKRKKVWEGKKRPEHSKKISNPIVEIKEDGVILVWDNSLICAEKNNYNYPNLINAVNGKNHNRGHFYKTSEFFKKDEYDKMLAEQAN